MPKHRLVRVAHAVGIAVSVLAGAMMFDRAAAQTQTAEAAPMEKIEVTGSAIRRTDTETPSPVQVITSQDLKRSGYTDISDVLRNVAANGAGSLSQSFNFAFAGGASGIALRGLAVGDTLVLIDGHRTAPYSISDDNQRNFVDVSNIPLDAVDHVEILRDGASALYGSDAIAGVVNIILKKTFQGLHASADYGESQRGDGATNHLTAMYGLGDLETDGRNGYVALEYRHQNEILTSDRNGLWNANNPRNWTILGGIDVTPGIPSKLNSGSFGGGLLSATGALQNPANSAQFSYLPGCSAAAQGADKCGFLYSGLQIQPPTENLNLTSKFTFKFGGGWESSSEFSVWDSRAEQLQEPDNTAYPVGFVGINTTGKTPVLAPGSPFVTTVPANYPGNPYGAAAPLIYTFNDVGDTQTHFDSINYRVIENVQGSAFGWDMSGALGYTYVHTDEIANNFINFPNLQTALNNGTYHVGQLASTNSASVYSFIAPPEYFGASDELDFIDLKGQRDLLQLPGGPLTMAIGAEGYHKNQNSQNARSVVEGVQAGVTGFAIGHQNDVGMFTEFDAQILKHFEMNAAVRADHQWTDYGAYGNSVKPHFGFKASPINTVTLRGTWSEGYRLPSAAESGNSATLFGAAATNDPALCPGGSTTPTNISAANPYYFQSQCAISPVNVQAPTTHLSPERSDNWTLGLIFEPTKWFYASADYFDYRIKNQIWSPFELGGLGFFGTYIRGASTSLPATNAITGLPVGNQITPEGLILYKAFPYENASSTVITGLDFEFRLKFDLAAYGRFTADLNASHQFKYIIYSFGNAFSVAGSQGPSGVSGDTGNPRTRATLNLVWDKGPGEVALTTNYTGRWSTNDPSFGQPAPCNGPPGGVSPSYNNGAPFAFGGFPTSLCYVASFTTFDLYGSYKVNKSWSVHAAVLNLADRSPSLDLSTYGGGGGGFWSTLETAGAVGRFFTGGVTYDF
jgi:iron complex outermembrane recepter protein